MDMNVAQQQQDLLERAGFTQAASHVAKKTAMARKLMLAYEHYRYVTTEQVKAFNAKIQDETRREPNPPMYNKYGDRVLEVCDQLVFVKAAEYLGIPPVDVLEAMAKAKAMEVFDGFTVASIKPVATKVQYHDPIVFGLVDGCTDYFYIAQWGDDVKLSDLISPTQG